MELFLDGLTVGCQVKVRIGIVLYLLLHLLQEEGGRAFGDGDGVVGAANVQPDGVGGECRAAAFDFGGDAFVHIGRGLLVDVTEGVFQRIFAHPYRRGEVIAVEVLFGGGYGIVVVHLVG